MRLILCLLIIISLMSCTKEKPETQPEITIPELEVIDKNNLFNEDIPTITSPTVINLSENSNGPNYELKNNVLKIGASGSFQLTGRLDGQIIIDASKSDTIHLLLDNTEIISKNSATIYIKKASKVYLETKENTINTLKTTENFVATDENNIDGVIYSKKPLYLLGNGTLDVITDFGHAIEAKDIIYFESGNYNFNSSTSSISSNQTIKINHGSYTINSNTNGIQAANNDQVNVGDIYINDAKINITAKTDAIEAANNLQIVNGTFTINAQLKGLKATKNLILQNGDYLHVQQNVLMYSFEHQVRNHLLASQLILLRK